MMRQNDRNAGSIKALLILALLVANIIAALPRHRASQHPAAGSERSGFSGRLHEAARLEGTSFPND